MSVTAKVLDLAYDREEAASETAHVGETSSWFSERRLRSRQVQFQLQAGAQFSGLGKFGPVLGVGAGYGRRNGGERAAGGRVTANSKIPDPMVHFEGHVEFRFTFHHGVGARAEAVAELVAGVVPYAVAIPKQEHHGAGHGYPSHVLHQGRSSRHPVAAAGAGVRDRTPTCRR